MNERQSYKEKINKIEELIHKYIRYGYFCFKPLGGKELRIKEFSINDKEQKITFILETKFKETYDFPVSISKLDNFLNNLQPCISRPVLIKQEKKSISYNSEQISFGFTKEYSKFRIMKKSISKIPLLNISESIEKFGNIIPIIVFQKQEKWIILEGKKRFNYLMEKGQDIFYIDITSLIKVEINERFVTDINIAINNPKIYQIWEDLCKYYYPEYKKVDEFFKQNNIERFISKWRFLHLLEPKWKVILDGEANLSDYRKLYEMILEYCKLEDITLPSYNKNHIYQAIKEKYKPLEKDKKTGIVKERWYQKFMENIIWGAEIAERTSFELVNNKIGFYKIKISKGVNFGFEVKLIKDERPEYDFLTRQCELHIQVDNIERFLEDNDILFQAILDSPIFIDLNNVLNEVIEERKVVFNLLEENKQFITI